jgi:hypothetical protein
LALFENDPPLLNQLTSKKLFIESTISIRFLILQEMYAELVQKNNTLHENKAKAEKASDAQTKAWHIDEMSNMLDKQNKKVII